MLIQEIKVFHKNNSIFLIFCLIFLFVIASGFYVGQNWPRLTSPIELPGKTLRPAAGEIMVILLGTGSPQSSYQRARPSQLLIIGDKTFLVDCGGGAVGRMFTAGINPGSINHLFFTHHHSDHNTGFLDFFITGWISALGGRTEPLNVYGPPGTEHIIRLMRKSLDYDISLRSDHVGHAPPGSQINYAEMMEGVFYDDGLIKITVFPVGHRPMASAVGYRFEYNGKAVVFSGDTVSHENVIKYSLDADMLVHEAYSASYMRAALKKYPHLENEIRQVMKYHSSTHEAAQIAATAGVKRLALTHLMPSPSQTWYFEKYFIQGMRDIYQGKIIIGRDLLTIKI
jgi:ribonuclease Z